MMEKSKMLNMINALDFALLEMTLFLDTHPTDQKAFKLREEYMKKRDDMIMEYEKVYGPYIVTTRNVHPKNYWQWISSPWPWEYVAED